MEFIIQFKSIINHFMDFTYYSSVLTEYIYHGQLVYLIITMVVATKIVLEHFLFFFSIYLCTIFVYSTCMLVDSNKNSSFGYLITPLLQTKVAVS